MRRPPAPPRIHIIGRKNHGKTTLVCELVEILVGRGVAVGTVKHTHHEHELDLPGKDSYRHRKSGAFPAAILSQSSCAVFWDAARSSEEDQRYSLFESVFGDCELIIVEGDQSTSSTKVEVWRASVGSEPLVRHDRSIRLLVTDDDVDVDCPVVRRSDIESLADAVLEMIRP